jgi:hemerythrin
LSGDGSAREHQQAGPLAGGLPMALIEWGPSLLVGVREIDEQHQHLVALINCLQSALGQAEAEDVLRSSLMHALLKYCRFHFAAEERLMDEQHYAYSVSHKSEHRQFQKQISVFESRLDGGQLVAIETLAYLANWFWEHIRRSDKKLGVQFNLATEMQGSKLPQGSNLEAD